MNELNRGLSPMIPRGSMDLQVLVADLVAVSRGALRLTFQRGGAQPSQMLQPISILIRIWPVQVVALQAVNAVKEGQRYVS